MAAVRSLGLVHSKLMNKYPFSMQAVQSGMLMGSGDFIAQTFIEKKPITDINWRRALNYFLAGFVIVGPVIPWYKMLDRRFGTNGFKTTLQKTVVDQAIFAPCFLPMLMTTIAMTEGKSFKEINEQVSRDYKDVLLTNYKVWPIVQIVNFSLVPLNYRVIFVQIVSVGSNTYLSWKLNSS